METISALLYETDYRMFVTLRNGLFRTLQDTEGGHRFFCGCLQLTIIVAQCTTSLTNR